MYEYVRVCMCVCVRVCKKERDRRCKLRERPLTAMFISAFNVGFQQKSAEFPNSFPRLTALQQVARMAKD